MILIHKWENTTGLDKDKAMLKLRHHMHREQASSGPLKALPVPSALAHDNLGAIFPGMKDIDKYFLNKQTFNNVKQILVKLIKTSGRCVRYAHDCFTCSRKISISFPKYYHY